MSTRAKCLRRSLGVLCGLLTAAALAGCGSGSAPSGATASSSTTLNTAYYADPAGGIDPDVFYDVEGDSLMLAVYDTLLTYAPGTTRIVPALATSWSVSPDGRTYTFRLRRGVKFHDGTAFNAQAVEVNFKRRIQLKQAVSYMTAGVAKMETPTPYTFVVRLRQRNNAFLDYMASMYGPKIVSPTALRLHAAQQGTAATKWLSSHEDGTGPYQLATYSPGSEYVLHRFNGYWGQRPSFGTIVIHVIPEVASAELELRSGSLDMLPRGIPFSTLPDLKAAGLTVSGFAAAIRQVLLLNPSKPPFNSQVARQTAAAAIQAVAGTAVRSVFGQYSQPARSEYPQVMSHGSEIAPIPALPSRRLPQPVSITLTYTSDEPALLQLAQYFQQALDKAGFNVTLRGDTVSQEFGYTSDPKAGPNATLSTFNPDASYPDTWGRPVWHTGGGLNIFGWSDPALDHVLDAAAAAPTAAQAEQLFAQAGERAGRDAYVLPIDDTEDVTVARASVTGFDHVPAYIWMVNLADLRNG